MNIPDDYDVKPFARAIRSGALHACAMMDSVFPPDSPTSARRGGNKTALGIETRTAVCAILDAMTGNPRDGETEFFQAAMKSANVGFFRMMAEAAQHVRDMPHTHRLFAQHVIAARRIAADMMGEDGPLPSWRNVKKQVIAVMGQSAYGEVSRDWGRVKRAAGLRDLPR